MVDVHRLFLRAVREGQIKAVKKHLDSGADINARFASGYNALMLSAGSGNVKPNHAEIVMLLLQKGIDTSYRTKDGDTAISLAEERENHQFSEMIKSFEQQKHLVSVINSDNREESGLKF